MDEVRLPARERYALLLQLAVSRLLSPLWVPLTNSPADEVGVAPSDIDGSDFFDTSATYRGAFEPGGEDWTAGWTSYP